MEIEIVKGNIAEEHVCAIVNAASTQLFMGGGVAGVLKKAGGESIEREALKHAPIGLGECIVTHAGTLHARYIIHAAAMPDYGTRKASQTSIWKATLCAIEKADMLGCESISLPAIGCGIAGFPIEKGAYVILSAVMEHRKHNKHLAKVRVVLINENHVQMFKEALEDIKRERSLNAEKCLKMLQEQGVPENVIRHSIKVKEVATALGEKLANAGEYLDLHVLTCAALLHDIDKMKSIEGKCRHGELGAQILRNAGYRRIAWLIESHVLEHPKLSRLNTWEEKLLYYADKLVLGERIVTVEERFSYLIERYGHNKQAIKRILSCKPFVLTIEEEIKTLLKMHPYRILRKERYET
jgi:putative nucleotidyltransferase with HDIG domain